MATKKQFLAICRHYLGYQGKKSNDCLEDFAANTSGKYNLFAKMFDDQFALTGGPLNTRKQNQDYCAIGLLYCAIKACGGDIYKGFELLCQTWGGKVDNCAAGVGFVWNYFGYYKRQSDTPEVGDIAFLWDASANKISHVCVVEEINGNEIGTIDFNWGNNVCRCSRDISEYRGFGRPKYDPEEEDCGEDEPENAEIAEIKQYETPVIEEISEAKVSETITIPRDEYNGYLRTIAELSSGKTAAEQRAELAEQELENIREALKKLL